MNACYETEFWRMLQCAADDAQKMMQSDWPQCATLLCRAREALQAAAWFTTHESGFTSDHLVWTTQCRLELERMAKMHRIAVLQKGKEFLHALRRHPVLENYAEKPRPLEPPPCPMKGTFVLDLKGDWYVFVQDTSSTWDGWLARFGAHGQWVTLRKATLRDRAAFFQTDEHHHHIYGEEQ